VLGVGGFGITYRAWDTRLNAMMAIKEFFPRELISRIPGETKVRVFSGNRQETYKKQLGRFMDEAKNLAKFTGDEHIVNVLDFFEDNGTAYIVMEYLEGMTLKEYMAAHGGRLPAERSLAIALALLKATSRIHSIGIIHRDISPDNIFVLTAGNIKVLDFGAAQFASKDTSGLSHEVVVKKGYAPPEQYRTNMKQGVWTDIYAVGATLYKMTTGITPDESIERTEKDELKRPSQTGTDVDMIIDKAVMKAMALRPELRFKTADAMLAALENRTAIDFPEEELKKRQTRNRIAIAVSVLLVVVLSALVAWQATNQPEQVLVAIPGVPSLANVQIEPDTIVFYVQAYNEEKTRLYSQLADAFMDAYPEHKVIIENFQWYDGIHEDNAVRFMSEDAPTVFYSHMPGGLNQWETPYKANLSMLINAIDMSEYVLLNELVRVPESMEMMQYGGTVQIFELPFHFEFQAAFVNLEGARERGIEPPTAIESYEQIIALEMEMPGSVRMSVHNLHELLGILKPELANDRITQPVEDIYVEFVRMWRQGYFNSNQNPDVRNPVTSQYRRELLEFGRYSKESWQWRGNNRQAAIAPIIGPDRKILADIYQHDSRFSVSSHVSENKQLVGMLFLHFLLSENGQNIMCIQNNAGIPLNRKALEQFADMNPEVAFLAEYMDSLTSIRQGGFFIDDLEDILSGVGDYEDELRERVRRRLVEWFGWS